MKSDTLAPTLLNIQKVIKLADGKVVDEFKKYLLEIDALMAHKLVDSINRSVNLLESLSELSTKVYGSDSKRNKQSLSQLSLHAFRFTSYIMQNFPYHLHHNLVKIQELINEGNPIEANLIADMMIDLCEKTCDYNLLQSLYQFKAAQAHINRKFNEQSFFISESQKVLSYQSTLNELNYKLRHNFDISEKDDTKLPFLKDYISFFKSFFDHESPVVVRFAKFAVIFITYYYQNENFNSEEIQSIIESFDEDAQKNSFLHVAFLEDLNRQVYFFQLNQPFQIYDQKAIKNFYKRLHSLSQYQHYWKSYVNIPEFYSIVAKTTSLLNYYQNLYFRPDFQHFLHDDDKELIDNMKQFCHRELKKFHHIDKFQTDQIHITIVLSALALLGNEQEKNSCIKQLEMTMITYQQMSFSMSIDTIMALLMSAYFSLHKYEDCINTYRRFQKLSKGRVINKQNETTIQIYYFYAQWIQASRPQYLNKLDELVVQIKSSGRPQHHIELIRSLSNYYKVPIYLN